MHTASLLRQAVAAVTILVAVAAGPGGPAAQAQVWSTQLPTAYAGDYLNGSASSDAAGGLFTAGHAGGPAPSTAFGIPTAFGADWRDGFAAVGGHIGRSRGESFIDGAIFIGTGVGSSRRLVGIEGTLAIYDLVGDVAKERSVSLKVHRRIFGRWAIAAGMENLLLAGHTDGGKSGYAVLSGSLPLRGRADSGTPRRWIWDLAVTVGIGDGRFNDESAVRRDHNGANLFGSASLLVTPAFSLFTTWTGQDVLAGISIVPSPHWPIVITPALLNIDGRGGHGARFAMSVGAGLQR